MIVRPADDEASCRIHFAFSSNGIMAVGASNVAYLTRLESGRSDKFSSVYLMTTTTGPESFQKQTYYADLIKDI